jgi:glutamate synthase (NADPH/NADH) large chain
LIEKHRQLTGSAKAAAILDNWENYRSRFVKVMPVEYRKALQKMQEQANEAASPDASVAVGA